MICVFLKYIRKFNQQQLAEQSRMKADNKAFRLAIAQRKVLALSVSGALAALAVVSSPPTEAAGLEEVIVTAQKREQSLVDVPISITVFSDQKLEMIRATELRDYLDLTPNVADTPLKAVAVAFSWDLGNLIIGMVLPFWAMVGSFVGLLARAIFW